MDPKDEIEAALRARREQTPGTAEFNAKAKEQAILSQRLKEERAKQEEEKKAQKKKDDEISLTSLFNALKPYQVPYKDHSLRPQIFFTDAEDELTIEFKNKLFHRIKVSSGQIDGAPLYDIYEAVAGFPLKGGRDHTGRRAPASKPYWGKAGSGRNLEEMVKWYKDLLVKGLENPSSLKSYSHQIINEDDEFVAKAWKWLWHYCPRG